MSQDPWRWASPLPCTWRDRIRALAAPALLVAVAVLGVQRSVTLDQSSWQGASFGMFATYDNDVSRSVTVDASAGDERVRVRLPSDLQDDARRLQVVPDARRATRLAQAVLDRTRGAGTASVTVTVWRIVLADGDDGLRLHVEPLVRGEATS